MRRSLEFFLYLSLADAQRTVTVTARTASTVY